MSKKKQIYPINKRGKYCGYREYEDGSIEVASYHSDKMFEIMLQERALDSFVASVILHCQKLLVPIEKDKRQFWESLAEDYSLDLYKYNYIYYGATNRVKRESKEEPKTEDKL